MSTKGISLQAKPSGNGCAECEQDGGWWLHLRRCAECGHVGCCDSSPGQHATAHFHSAHHPIMQSFEPGEDWFYDYRSKETTGGPPLAPPDAHPSSQPAPGPSGKVPKDWQSKLHP